MSALSERQAQQQASETTSTASSDARGFAKLLTIIGGLLCFTPLWAIGLCLAAIGLYFWPVTHVVEPVEVQAITEAESNGGGYGWLLAAIGIIIFAGVLFVALVGVTLGGM